VSLWNSRERQFLDALSRLTYCNPFEPERIEHERAALGGRFQEADEVAWHRAAQPDDAERENVVGLTTEAERLVRQTRGRLADGARLAEDEFRLYEDLVTYVLYYRHFSPTSEVSETTAPARIAKGWRAFRDDWADHLRLPGVPDLPPWQTPDLLFACLYQVRRAFQHIFHFILGDSLPAAELRGMVWQSIFTHDMRRYQRSLYRLMSEVTTLITGPSGTGKELVARAIGMSQFLAFDPVREAFVDDLKDCFIPLNLSALSPTLIESELFGHRKGAFTGAVADRVGWLEQCRVHGAVFLDEIGELDQAIQVKLLRVVQTRAFSRLGETHERPFLGKIIVATNRELDAEMEAGRFRMDLYYRLCADHIRTPSLSRQLADRPAAISGLIRYLAGRIAGDEADAVAADVESWIAGHLPDDYQWPGNIRELEQCVRNVMIRNRYQPRRSSSVQGVPNGSDAQDAGRQPGSASASGPRENPRARMPESNSTALSASSSGSTKGSSPGSSPGGWLEAIENRNVTAEELLAIYITWVYAHVGTYEGTAAQLGLDRRTVKSKLSPQWLSKFRLSGKRPSP